MGEGKAGMKKESEGDADFDDAGELSPTTDEKKLSYERADLLIDSGASVSALPKSMASGVPGGGHDGAVRVLRGQRDDGA